MKVYIAKPHGNNKPQKNNTEMEVRLTELRKLGFLQSEKPAQGKTIDSCVSCRNCRACMGCQPGPK